IVAQTDHATIVGLQGKFGSYMTYGQRHVTSSLDFSLRPHVGICPGGVSVPFFGRPHLVTHPGGAAQAINPAHAEEAPRDAHVSIQIVLLHYLLTADGTPPAERWLAFRELPDGLFYAQAFAGHAEGLLAEKFGADLARFKQVAEALGGQPLGLADTAYRFPAFPRLAVAALLWEGDEDFPAQARILFDAHAGHYLPTEDLAGIGDWLAHRLTR
ncbi:MAG: hypothetical protein QG637_1036, partial [Chloroflexota bacterium]|nr:hypothetical protein [Chloroflexota bacterium]